MGNADPPARFLLQAMCVAWISGQEAIKFKSQTMSKHEEGRELEMYESMHIHTSTTLNTLHKLHTLQTLRTLHTLHRLHTCMYTYIRINGAFIRKNKFARSVFLLMLFQHHELLIIIVSCASSCFKI